jgi:hypothetical protein
MQTSFKLMVPMMRTRRMLGNAGAVAEQINQAIHVASAEQQLPASL